MKVLKRVLLALVVLLVLAVLGSWLYVRSLRPQYDGALNIPELQQPVKVLFDGYGVPHIYAQNEHDAYMALGYVHAQERLFQMELIRRAAGGRLAEVLGPELVKTDKLFRTLGIAQHAAASAGQLNDTTQAWVRAARAYMQGINHYIATGDTPIEFTLIGIPKTPFEPVDMYLVAGATAFSFAEALRTDPVIERVLHKYGAGHLADLGVGYTPGTARIPVHVPASNKTDKKDKMAMLNDAIDALPLPIWIGSNGWAIAGSKTASGKAMLANDTHMGYSQPGAWYEAHIEYPGFSFYGNHLAGYPFALVGHTRTHAWGLTMLENDDFDLYRERVNPQNPLEVWENDKWAAVKTREEIIQVKGGEPIKLQVRITRHGPIVTDIVEELRGDTTTLAAWWTYTQFPVRGLEATYSFAHAQGIDQVRDAVAMIHAPGLNVMYADASGNIAWWAAARLVQRPKHVNSKLYLDGASGKDEPIGYFDFSYNPRNENPPSGFIYSANNQPDTMRGILHPGYYYPEDRGGRIASLLAASGGWTPEKVQQMQLDTRSTVQAALAQQMASKLQTLVKDPAQQPALQALQTWDGSHDPESTGSTIWYKLHWHLLRLGMMDEMSEADVKTILTTAFHKSTYPKLFANTESPWWDDVTTPGAKEGFAQILQQAWASSWQELNAQLGNDVAQWQWQRVHLLTLPHPAGRVKPLDKLFNVGPRPVPGGAEVINNIKAGVNAEGVYYAGSGPAMRIVIDFADVDAAQSVLPGGQSGVVGSPHYDDQADLYVQGKWRGMLMKKEQIEQQATGTLLLQPK